MLKFISCPHVCDDKSRAVVSVFLYRWPTLADQFFANLITVDLSHYYIFHAKIGILFLCKRCV